MSKGCCWCLHLYNLGVQGGASDVLCSFWCSHLSESWVLAKTPSHIWGRLCLPMFLFRQGLWTLMYVDSLTVLTKPCSSLAYMLKLSIMIRWPVVVWWLCIGEVAFSCSFYLSLNVLSDFSMYFSSHSTLSHLYQCALYVLFVLWWCNYVLDCSIAPEMHADTILTTYTFDVFTEALYICYDYVSLVCGVLVVVLCVVGFVLLKILVFHPGYGPWWVLVMYSESCFSVVSSSVVDNTVFALCVKVLITLYLVHIWWWLSQCKYWSIQVGFLYTLVVYVPLCTGMINMSKNGIEPSTLCFLL